MKVILRKIEDCENPVHPDHIQPGFVKVGYSHKAPQVGQCFHVSEWVTSEVQEVISNKKFRTLNSIYEWGEIFEEQPVSGPVVNNAPLDNDITTPSIYTSEPSYSGSDSGSSDTGFSGGESGGGGGGSDW